MEWIVLLIVGKDNKFGLREPGWSLLGGLGIVAGLACVMYDNVVEKARAQSADTASPLERFADGIADGGGDESGYHPLSS